MGDLVMMLRVAHAGSIDELCRSTLIFDMYWFILISVKNVVGLYLDIVNGLL